ncbi:hypothetical protein SASPL_101679 [Salvia splendens]|uniref:Uncharacterized protein n=1 Tax=Salvia splendens TaxID=180675 RepID=A0A8X8YUE8_SALSN|nr:hypothetical protein SASPL_101679 [Salvia splendens]
MEIFAPASSSCFFASSASSFVTLSLNFFGNPSINFFASFSARLVRALTTLIVAILELLGTSSITTSKGAKEAAETLSLSWRVEVCGAATEGGGFEGKFDGVAGNVGIPQLPLLQIDEIIVDNQTFEMVDTRKSSTDSARQLRSGRTSGEVKAELKYNRKKTTVIGRKIDEEEGKTSSQKKKNASISSEIPHTEAKGSSLSILDAAKGPKNSVLEEMMNLKQTSGAKGLSLSILDAALEEMMNLNQTSGGNDCNDERRTKTKHDELQNIVNKGTKRMRETESALPSGVQTDKDKDKRKQIAKKVAESANVQGKAIESLNDDQRDVVEDMGFGSLLHFNLTYIPAKLAFEILDHFYQDTCGVVYQRGILHIGHDDVRATLGLPNGGLRLEDNGHQKTNKFINEIAESVGRKRSNMGAKMLTDMMLSDIYGGEKFRNIFLILVDTILINPSGDGLLDAHKTWARNKDKPFTGPISFLVPCYVDRIVLRSRPVTQTFPTIKGWTSTLIHEREYCVLPKDISLTAQRRSTVVNLMGKAADVQGELMKELEDGADDLKNNGCSKVAAKCSMKMMGLHEMEPEEEVNYVQSMSQAMEEDDLDNPEFITAVEKVMRVVEQRKKWQTEGPSFDLGFEFHERNVS